MKTALFAVVGLLALSFVPVSGHAQMPGEKCGGADKVQVGTTKIATDSQNIIACLLTGNTAPGANVSEWKAMTSSNNGGGGGSGGLTGGCFVQTEFIFGKQVPGEGYRGDLKITSISDVWGRGCDVGKLNNTWKNIVLNNGYPSPCDLVAASGHACGLVDSGSWGTENVGMGRWGTCICSKE